MFTSNKLAIAVRCAVMGMTAVSTLAITSATAAETAAKEDALSPERIQVTGSRIKRVDMEGASPVSIIDVSAQIESSGQFSVADVLKRSNLNTFGSFSEGSGSTWQSQATVDLRGAGSDRTLVLINGKRMPGSPTLGGSSVNLNTIPTAAIERIEVLTDGASAVYGSDAVAGVVNIITKSNFEGVEISATVTSPEQDGGDEQKFHAILGTSSDKGSVSVSIEHLSRDIIFQRDRWFSKASNTLAENYDLTTGVSIYARNFLDMTTYAFNPLEACNNPKMVGEGHIYDLNDGDFACGYDYTSEAADHASRDYTAGFFNATYEISDGVDFNSQVMFSRNESFGRYAPAAGWFNAAAGQVALQDYNAPRDENGMNVNPGRVYYRFTDVGTRDTTVVDYTTDVQIGLVGSTESFDWDVSYHYNLQDSTSIGSGYVHRPTVEKLVEDGEFNFGVEGNSSAAVAAMHHNTLATNVMAFHMLNAGVTFDLGTLAGGDISWYAGAEYIDYDYSSLVDAESSAGEVIGSSGNGSAGTRDVKALFAETVMPVTDDLELNMALRFDDYSDFGTNLAPKVSVKYKITEDLILRSSWGKGFRAPSLSNLYAADSFSADSATDLHTCELAQKEDDPTAAFDPAACRSKQYDVTRKANENLEAEESEFLTAGVVWQITDNLSTSLEYYDLEVDNVIQFVSLDSLLRAETKLGYGNLTRGEVIRAGDNPDGKILEASTQLVNGKGFSTSGLDFNVTYSGLETGAGIFGTNLDVTYVLDYNGTEYFDGPVNNKVGRNGLPQVRASWIVDWQLGDHSAYIQASYIHEQYEKNISGKDDNGNETFTNIGHLTSQIVLDASYSYATSWNGTATVGVRNLTDEDPVLDTNLEYEEDLYSLYGRTFFANYTQKF